MRHKNAILSHFSLYGMCVVSLSARLSGLGLPKMLDTNQLTDKVFLFFQFLLFLSNGRRDFCLFVCLQFVL